MATRPTFLSLAADLVAGRITSRALVEVALATSVPPQRQCLNSSSVTLVTGPAPTSAGTIAAER